MTGLENLKVYQMAFDLAMNIFHLSKSFPKEEKYSLTDQVRRSSRAVCANLAEAYRKRRYPAHFINKLSDADMENSETQVWLNFARDCDYVNIEKHDELFQSTQSIGKILNFMIHNPNKFSRKDE